MSFVIRARDVVEYGSVHSSIINAIVAFDSILTHLGRALAVE